MNKIVLSMVGILLVGSLSAKGEIVFSDDFSGDLSKWTYDGNTNISNGQLILEPVSGSPWHSSATTKESFTRPGKYTLTFDTDANGDPAFQENVTMPGGLEIGFSSWGNSAQVRYKGVLQSGSVVGTGVTDAGTIRTIKMVLDGRNAEIYVNGTLGWGGTLTSDPDFGTYKKITLSGQYSVITNKYDNISLEAEYSYSNTIVFWDSFSKDLSQWTYDGNANIFNGQLVLEPVSGSPWHSSVTTNQSFPGPGKYTLTFDTDANGDPAFQENVTMPGGLEIGFLNWSGLAQVKFKGVLQSGSVAGTGVADVGTMRTIKMVLDGRNAEIYVNGTLGWNGTMTSDPDFATYNKIAMSGQFSVITNKYDNILLEAEYVYNESGDANHDGVVDVNDIDAYYYAIRAGSKDPNLDLNGDQVVNVADIEYLIQNKLDAQNGLNVFMDDFSGDLMKWAYDGNANISSGLLVLEPAGSDPWHVSVSSIQTFSAAGKYELSFDTDANGDPAFQENVTMPGGLEIGFSSWGNSAQVNYKGVLQSGNVAGSGVVDAGTMRTIKMVLDGRKAEIYVNGTLGWSGTLDSDPDFGTYNKITLYGQYSVITNKYDNILLNFKTGGVVLIPGDANGDQKVDVSDLGILAANYGTTSGATRDKGDFNNDGKVDVSDLGILAANYGTGTGKTLDFKADAQALGLGAAETPAAAKEATPNPSALGCGSVGLPLVVGLMLAGLLLSVLKIRN